MWVPYARMAFSDDGVSYPRELSKLVDSQSVAPSTRAVHGRRRWRDIVEIFQAGDRLNGLNKSILLLLNLSLAHLSFSLSSQLRTHELVAR